jgi:hypothetical protein
MKMESVVYFLLVLTSLVSLTFIIERGLVCGAQGGPSRRAYRG